MEALTLIYDGRVALALFIVVLIVAMTWTLGCWLAARLVRGL